MGPERLNRVNPFVTGGEEVGNPPSHVMRGITTPHLLFQ